MNKEKTFEWNDELVAEYSQRLPSYFNQGHSNESALRGFKKEKLEFKATIKDLYNDGKEIDGSREGISFVINGYSAPFYIKKDRLAEMLINESNKNWKRESRPMSEEDVIAPKQKAIINGCPSVSPFEDVVNKKVYSQKEYLQFGQECFGAARKNNSEWYYKFKNFSDYMNSKGEEK